MAFIPAIFCISVVLVQTISCRCIESPIPVIGGCDDGMARNVWADNSIGLVSNGYVAGRFSSNNGYSGVDLRNALGSVDTYGGSLLVTSSSPLAPRGLSVVSENSLEGPLSVAGKLPFLGAVALEGALPAGGTAQAAYGCGSGDVRILETYGTEAGYGSGNTGFGLGARAASFGYGAGAAGLGMGTEVTSLGLGAGAADLGLGAGFGYGAGIIAGNRGCGCGGIYY